MAGVSESNPTDTCFEWVPVGDTQVFWKLGQN